MEVIRGITGMDIFWNHPFLDTYKTKQLFSLSTNQNRKKMLSQPIQSFVLFIKTCTIP